MLPVIEKKKKQDLECDSQLHGSTFEDCLNLKTTEPRLEFSLRQASLSRELLSNSNSLV